MALKIEEMEHDFLKSKGLVSIRETLSLVGT